MPVFTRVYGISFSFWKASKTSSLTFPMSDVLSYFLFYTPILSASLNVSVTSFLRPLHGSIAILL